ncbi:MAG TPA: APC family permease [Gemmataceae bacterium]|jgi:amino acid transporter/nucleotide-binding universal stress UspA family protein
MTTSPAGPTPPGDPNTNRQGAPNTASSLARRLKRPTQIIIVSSVMFSFIGYWRTAAVVLCDLASTAYYIGGIVEQSIGSAAPWFILAVMFFSYAVRSVYIESCTLFVRGGVYRVVREALGKFMAKLAVSSLMFDYILTGPISAVSGGQYIVGLITEVIARWFNVEIDPSTRDLSKRVGSVILATTVTLYFFRKNIIGIHESSEKALKIMIVTTIMGAIMLTWCGVTLAVNGVAKDKNGVPNTFGPMPDFQPHFNATTQQYEDPTGFLNHAPVAQKLRDISGKPWRDWLSLVGMFGIFIAFGHSILAMSGEETLAQVYREIESPKLVNFKKAALIVFLYSIVLTGGISFLAVLLIPADVRMHDYSDNLIGGLAMNVAGPLWAKLLLNGFVVVVGGLILSGAVNTAIIGSNGVLNRVAEDGVMPQWFLKPHPRYGTTYRILWLIFLLQLFTIWASFGDVLLLGEAYAFGVVWSFVFQALSMVVLRFTNPRPREAKVPLNIRMGKYEVPIGLMIILVLLMIAAVCNLLTKQVATIGGLIFTGVFFTMFFISERFHERKRAGKRHEHLEQFNEQRAEEVSAYSLNILKQYRKLVAIRSPHNLFMLEKALAETDPETTGIVVMTAKLTPMGADLAPEGEAELDSYDQQLMTAVVEKAERTGKHVTPLIIPTNNPLHAVLTLARDIQANEVIMGASNRYTADEQLEQIAFYWISLHGGNPAPMTVRILSRERDMYLDLAGGNRIPKISERKARSVAELRAAGVGVDRVLLLHDGSPANSDLFQAVVTMLDAQVALGIVPVVPSSSGPLNGRGVVHQDEERARQLGRELQVISLPEPDGRAIVEQASKEQFDLIILPLSDESPNNPLGTLDDRARYILQNAHCRVFLAAHPVIPQEVVDKTPSRSP